MKPVKVIIAIDPFSLWSVILRQTPPKLGEAIVFNDRRAAISQSVPIVRVWSGQSVPEGRGQPIQDQSPLVAVHLDANTARSLTIGRVVLKIKHVLFSMCSLYAPMLT
jgi:hypothetical protein